VFFNAISYFIVVESLKPEVMQLFMKAVLDINNAWDSIFSTDQKEMKEIQRKFRTLLTVSVFQIKVKNS